LQSDEPASVLQTEETSECLGIGPIHVAQRATLHPIECLRGGEANGNTLDGKGRLVTAEHGARRISRTDRDGNILTVADSYAGKAFNSPNDVVVKSDGTFWFTDPDYGLEDRTAEMEGNFVFRHDPESGQTTLVARGFDKPNGLCFSPNEKLLYVADSGAPRHVRVFDVQKDGSLSNNRVFYWVDKGAPDGIRCDYKGRLFITAGDGVHIVGRDGALIGKILMDQVPANLCFGAQKNRTLFITARTSLYAIELETHGQD